MNWSECSLSYFYFRINIFQEFWRIFMVMNTASVRGAPIQGVLVEEIANAKSVKSSIGHTCTRITRAIKDVAAKIGRAIADSFRNFPKFIRSGYGAGTIGAVAGGGLLVTAIALKGEKQQVARALLIVAACTTFFASAAVMFAFGRNPVTFNRAPSQLGW